MPTVFAAVAVTVVTDCGCRGQIREGPGGVDGVRMGEVGSGGGFKGRGGGSRTTVYFTPTGRSWGGGRTVKDAGDCQEHLVLRRRRRRRRRGEHCG